MNDRPSLARALETTIHVGLVLGLVAWCFWIVRPFATLVVWGIIIAIAAHPSYRRLEARLGGRRWLAATLFTTLLLLVLVVPIALLTRTLVQGVRSLSSALSEGTLVIPAPPETIAGLPLAGTWLERTWLLASTNLREAVREAGPQLRPVALWLLSGAAGVGLAMLQLVAAIAVAGALLAHAGEEERRAFRIARRLGGERGAELARIAQATVRSVAQGILGVALIQSLLAGLGFLAIGLPGAGLLALLCLALALFQIGPFPVLLASVIYVFSVRETPVALVFLGWCVFVGVIDNVLKPVMLGRGVDLPLLVVAIGAVGGLLAQGFIGLFVGPVVLAVGYTLASAWIAEEPATPPR
jgi:predicted PurR-regulated permease PerM